MSIWSFLRPRTPNPHSILDFVPGLKLSPYVGEYLAAIDRTEEFGFEPPPFNLTIGWIVRNGKAICQHDERLIQRFIEGNTDAWVEEGCPFHLWLTSPACEILDVTLAMNLRWAKSRQECADLIVYQSAHDPPSDSIYHPTLVGSDFFHKTGG